MTYLEVNARRVMDACTALEAAIQQRRTDRQERLIALEMASGWFRPKTREAAIMALQDQGIWGDYHFSGVYGWGDLGKSRQILSAARVAVLEKTTLKLSAADAELLEDFWPDQVREVSPPDPHP